MRVHIMNELQLMMDVEAIEDQLADNKSMSRLDFTSCIISLLD